MEMSPAPEQRSHRRRTPVIAAGTVLLLALAGAALAIGGVFHSSHKASPHLLARRTITHRAPTLAATIGTTPTTPTVPITTSTTPTSSTTAGAIVTPPAQLATAQEPVRACVTTGGAGGATAEPRSIQARLPPDLAHTLSFYSSTALTLLAPAAWRCHGSVAEDGSASFVVQPSYYSPSSVIASTGGSCAGCSAMTACPFFPSAGALTPSRSCPQTEPKRQIERRINSTLVEFEDPPGVNGPSRFTAIGAMIYRHETDMLETCRLPAAQRATCSASLGDFIKRYDG